MSENVNPAKRARLGDVFDKYERPFVALDETKSTLNVMQVDIDYVTERPDPVFGMTDLEKVPVMRMFGVTAEGNSVFVRIHGFMPYFFVPCPEGFTDAAIFHASLENQLAAAGTREKLTSHVVSVEVVQRSTMMHWQGANHVPFFRVTVAVPSLVATSRHIIEAGFELADRRGSFAASTTFETNIAFVLRFMVDQGVRGGGWVQLQDYRLAEQKSSTCQVELDVHYSNVTHIEEMEIAPLRILSFDIECYNQTGVGFPRPKENPVIQIAVYLKEFGRSQHLIHAVWTLEECAPIAAKEVFCFQREEDLLMSFADFLTKTDPDILSGYNIINFDLQYLIERAETLGLKEFARLGRMRERTRLRPNNVGGRETIDVMLEGRVQFDMYQVIQKEYKLRSYSLNAVSAEFLAEQKEDVHHSEIGNLHRTSPETRKRLAIYCLKDAYLPMRLMEKLLCMYNYVEMARVTGTPINFLLNRGQMIKVTSQLLRKAGPLGFVMPTTRVQPSEDKYEGATVLEPITGFYEKPIATLDFASLYPSIMMAHNICYTTLVADRASLQRQGVDAATDVAVTPNGCSFVAAKVRKGLLPMILEELLSARKQAKKQMAEAEDPTKKMVLNGRQLALKLSANSVYGFTGAANGIMPCLEISGSVTAFGRSMIDHTKNMVEAHYTIAKGYAHDAEVVYGDTDSVMVKFGVETVKEAMDLGNEAADMVSKTFLKPIKLEFEKVYCPYLLMNKKRYAGLYWTNPEKYDKLDTKGIETVRRDNCALVRQVVDTVLNKILIDKSPKDAEEYVKGVISDLLQNKVDLSMLVITKSLGKGATAEDYAARQAHVELADRMRKRDPSSAPGTGDRVPYVIVTGAKNAPTYEKSEDPLYVLENGLQIDAQHYITHQFQQPLLRIFGPIMPNAESALFKGEHTRTLSTPAPATGALASFVVKGQRCLGCKAVIRGAKDQALCDYCKQKKAAQVSLEKVVELRSKEEEYNALWTQCQRCQGSCMQRVICSNRDCEIFYRRAKARKEVEALQEQMRRLQMTSAW